MIDRSQMGVNHRRLDMRMPQVGLNLMQGHTRASQMRGKTVAQNVTGRLLRHPRRTRLTVLHDPNESQFTFLKHTYSVSTNQ